MGEELRIEPATADDLDAIHALERAAFPAPWRREFFENELTANGRHNVVARRDGRLVGYLFGMYLFDEMHINKIAVPESERRQGIAHELMRECVTFARANGVIAISLEVRQSNHGAQEFYKFLGFAPSYLRPRYYPDGEAAVVMTRSV